MANAQCVITNTNVYGPGSSRNVVKYLSMSQVCQLTSSNALGCFPGFTATSNDILYAVANTSVTTAPFCNWSCACGQVTTNGSDGLPVELLRFEVIDGREAGDDEGSSEEESPPADAKPPRREER